MYIFCEQTDKQINSISEENENVMQDLNEKKMPHLAKMREWQCDLVPYVSLHTNTTNTCEKDLAAARNNAKRLLRFMASPPQPFISCVSICVEHELP